MIQRMKFSDLPSGADFRSSTHPDGDVFRKETDTDQAETGCTRCDERHAWNAFNLKGSFSVHFCPDQEVLVEVPDIDVSVANHGSVCMVSALSDAAKDWVNDNVHLEDWQMWGAGVTFACEPRYLDNLVAGMQEAGLEVA